jgi:hypothetical protein
MLFFGIDNAESGLSIAGEESNETLHLCLGIAGEAWANLIISAPRCLAEQRGKQCKQC